MVGRELYIDESESEIEVSDNSDWYFYDEGVTKTIHLVAPDKPLDNSTSLVPLHVDVDAESLQRKQEKTVTSHIVTTLKEDEAM